MLSLLLDEHLSPHVVPAARRFSHRIRIVSIHDWMQGHFLGAPDEELLEEAFRQKISLVTFDLKTIPLLLRSWAEQGIDHGGVILVDDRTFAQNDIGGIARALSELWKLQGRLDWTNRAFFLQPPKR
jgi:hypothetical protein